MDGKLLIATDGTDGAVGALHIALALARRGAGVSNVLAVQAPVFLAEGAQPARGEAQMALERLGMERLHDEVKAQLQELGDEALGWSVDVEVGPPAAVIADTARERGTGLILLGLGRHAWVDRWFGGETALGVIQLADVPVLAAHPGARDLPRRVLVADDFSDFSREAGERALDLIATGGELHLAHVLHVPSGTQAEIDTSDWVDGYVEAISARFEERRSELASTGRCTVEAHQLQGDPAVELLRLAEELTVDLIAAGRHGGGFLGRLLMGSVSSRLVRRAKCSVLVAPPLPGASGGG